MPPVVYEPFLASQKALLKLLDSNAKDFCPPTTTFETFNFLLQQLHSHNFHHSLIVHDSFPSFSLLKLEW